ncbi:MAG: manganese efflux pump MntP family protein [Bacilli bacterium]
MSIIEIILLSFGLAMDAFAVSICKGLTLKKMDWKKSLIAGGYFGVFQAIMPLIGYCLIKLFKQNEEISNFITKYDHWIAFILLIIIGINMIIESFAKEEVDGNFGFKTMFVLAIATSIDALSVGITFATMELAINIYWTVLIIGGITFILSALGVFIGNVFGLKFKQPAEIVGGVVLILIGLKILLNGLGIISF